jgi:hypothetical protein
VRTNQIAVLKDGGRGLCSDGRELFFLVKRSVWKIEHDGSSGQTGEEVRESRSPSPCKYEHYTSRFYEFKRATFQHVIPYDNPRWVWQYQDGRSEEVTLPSSWQEHKDASRSVLVPTAGGYIAVFSGPSSYWASWWVTDTTYTKFFPLPVLPHFIVTSATGCRAAFWARTQNGTPELVSVDVCSTSLPNTSLHIGPGTSSDKVDTST